jgi:hypothetical protein
LEKEQEEIQKVEECKALAEAKLQSKEAHAALKAQFELEQAAAAEAKKLEKVKLATERWAEKVRATADSKARRGGRKVCFLLVLALYLFTECLISLRPSNGRRHHKWSMASQMANSAFCQHQDSKSKQYQKSTLTMTRFKTTSFCSTLRTLPTFLSSARLCRSSSGIRLLSQT